MPPVKATITVKCTRCLGEGHWAVQEYDPVAELFEEFDITCPICNGTGTITTFRPEILKLWKFYRIGPFL